MKLMDMEDKGVGRPEVFHQNDRRAITAAETRVGSEHEAVIGLDDADLPAAPWSCYRLHRYATLYFNAL